MNGWKKCASLLLVLGGPVMAGEPCLAERARSVMIGAQRYAVEVAATAAARERGLSGRERLAPAAGMWFVLPETGRPGFWMRGMRFPIDLIWVSPERRVVGAATLPPCRGEPCAISYAPAPTAYVLEVAAGRFAGRAGDHVTWTCGDPPLPPDGP